MNYTTLAVPNDVLYIAATNKGLCYVGNEEQELFDYAAKRKEVLVQDNEAMSIYRTQFARYFSGNLETFHLTLDVTGTALQQQVWQTLMTIPFGEVWTYSDVAEKIGKPTAVRAVANAIGRNPVLVVIPCHRVIGKNRKLTGFRSGLAMKKTLLHLESFTTYKE